MLADSEDIWTALGLLAERAEVAGIEASIHLVGGAAVELTFGDRGATRDVDALIYQPGALDEIINQIAVEQRWPHDWLNDRVKQFCSHRTDPKEWPVARQNGPVAIHVAPVEVLVAMKLHAARGRRDFSDLMILLDHLQWDREQVQECFDTFYPEEALKPAVKGFLDLRFGAS